MTFTTRVDTSLAHRYFSARVASIEMRRLPTSDKISKKLFTFFGGLAQLGERLAGSQKVRGSNPLSSTEAGCAKTQLPASPGKSGVFLCACMFARESKRLPACTDCAGFCTAFSSVDSAVCSPPLTAASKCLSVVIK